MNSLLAPPEYPDPVYVTEFCEGCQRITDIEIVPLVQAVCVDCGTEWGTEHE